MGKCYKMKKKAEIKRDFIIIIILSVILLIVGVAVVLKYYNYRAGNDKESNFQITDLEPLAVDNSKIKKIIENKDSYPEILLEMLSRNPDMTDYVFNYSELKGKVFANDIGTVEKGTYPLLLQYDTGWGYGIYGNNVIAVNGCGPTSAAMVIAGLTGRNDITPYNVAEYSYKNGYFNDGTSWSFFTKGIENFGIAGTEIPLYKNKMVSELESGYPIILSMGKGDFTTTGHIIVVTGLKDGKFVINDPNSKERTSKLWSYEQIENQIKNLWSFRLI